MAAENDDVVIPNSWLQRLSKREVVSVIGILVAMGAWGYSATTRMETLESQLLQTQAELRAYIKEQDKRNEQDSIVLAVVSNSLTSIDKRLNFIETNVRKMAQ